MKTSKTAILLIAALFCITAAAPSTAVAKPGKPKPCKTTGKRPKPRGCKPVPVFCSQLQALPNLNDRSVSYRYLSKLPGKRQQAYTATWDEDEGVVWTDEEAPLIVRLAAVGWKDDGLDIDPIGRRLCAQADSRLLRAGTDIPEILPRWIRVTTWDHRPSRFAGLPRYGEADHAAALVAVNKHADKLGIGTPSPTIDYSNLCPPIEGSPGADPSWCL